MLNIPRVARDQVWYKQSLFYITVFLNLDIFW